MKDSDASGPLVLYYQVTLGPAHLARIRALDRRSDLRCRGVQLASRERTRAFDVQARDSGSFETVLDGVYEDGARGALLRAACRHLVSTGASAIIIDSPADPTQFLLGRWAQRHGILTFSRWAATILDHPRHRWKEWLKGFVYRGWDGYLVTGQRGAEYLRTFGVDEDRIHLCGNPVDHEPIDRTFERRSEASRRKSSFLFVGRFLRLKNLERFALAYLRYRELGGTWALDLVGFGESEPEVRRILSSCPDVVFHGHLQLDELVPMYASAGAVVLPSYSENWGLVVNEAMHAGAPVLVSEAAGCYPELLEEGGNGLGLDWRSEESMASTLLAFERLGTEARSRMSRRSREIIGNHTVESWAGCVAEAILLRLRERVL